MSFTLALSNSISTLQSMILSKCNSERILPLLKPLPLLLCILKICKTTSLPLQLQWHPFSFSVLQLHIFRVCVTLTGHALLTQDLRICFSCPRNPLRFTDFYSSTLNSNVLLFWKFSNHQSAAGAATPNTPTSARGVPCARIHQGPIHDLKQLTVATYLDLRGCRGPRP